MTAESRSLADLGLAARGGRETRITGLAVDSRLVKQGYLFAALPGSRIHGAEFIPTALRMGAGAVLTDAAGAKLAAEALAAHPEAAVVLAEDPREVLAHAAALWSGSQPATMVAVTGTNGKTSVASFTRQLWQALGHAAVNIGTTGVEGDFSAPSGHTTPEPITLHRLLADIAAEGIGYGAMEASSHGLDQRRLEGVRLSAAGFTNLTQDHLDYHGTMEGYFQAKLGLFTRLLPDEGVAVVDIDSPEGRRMADAAVDRGLALLRTGTHPDADLRILNQRFDATGQEVRFAWNGAPRQLRLNLVGGFQAGNVAVAAGLALATGSQPDEVFDALPKLTTVRGRMQLVATRRNGAAVYVDYAHTPDAVATALKALRPHVMGRIIVVMGAGGDRDKTKRPLMGRAAGEFADVVFVTDDNPRSEDPAAIRAQVREGCPEATEIGDRAEAILLGVDALQPGDALLIAGKGHETGQEIAGHIYPFDDAEQASVAVAALDGLI